MQLLGYKNDNYTGYYCRSTFSRSELRERDVVSCIKGMGFFNHCWEEEMEDSEFVSVLALACTYSFRIVTSTMLYFRDKLQVFREKVVLKGQTPFEFRSNEPQTTCNFVSLIQHNLSKVFLVLLINSVHANAIYTPL